MEHSAAAREHDKSIDNSANTPAIDHLVAALCLAAIAPLFQSIITWDTDGKLTASAFVVRHLSLPTVVLEIVIVYIASLGGLNLRKAYNSLSLSVKWAIAIWLVFALFTSIFISSDSILSIFVLIRYLIHGIVLASFVYLLSQSKYYDLKQWLATLTIGALLYLISLVIFVYLTRNYDNFPWALRLPSATNIRQIGNLLAILAIAPVTALLARDHTQKVFYFWAVALIVAFVTWTGTRGGMLGLALGSILGVLMAFKFTSSRNLALLVISWVTGILISIPFFLPAADFGLFRMVKTVTSDQEISPGRIEMWTDTLSEILKNPVLGFGSGSYRQNMFEQYQYDFNHPHNVVLQYMYDWGIVGGMAALMILACLGWRLFTIKNQGSTVRFLSIAGFCATLAIAMIEGTLFHPLPILIAIAMVSPALGTAPKSP